MERILIEKLRHIFLKNGWGEQVKYPELTFDQDRNSFSDLLFQFINQDGALMVTRLGSTELQAIIPYVVRNRKHSIYGYIKGNHPAYWYKNKYINEIQNNAGFFSC